MKRQKTQEGKPSARLPALDQDLVEFIEEHSGRIPIDEHDLIRMQGLQTDSYHAVGQRLSLEVSRHDAAKQFHRFVSARVEEGVRSDAKDTGEKVTEGSVATRVALDPEVIEAENLLLDAKRAVSDLTALKDSFMQRSVMLRDMAQLWIAGYYSDAATEGADKAVRRIQADETKRQTAKRYRQGRD